MLRTDLMDTKPWAHQEIIRRLRELTLEQKMKMVLDATETGMAMNRLAIARIAERRRALEANQQCS